MLLKDYFPNLNKKYQKVSFKGIAFNSRKIKKGYIFFAFKGNNTDGNLFIKDAIKNGSKIIISDKLFTVVFVGLLSSEQPTIKNKTIIEQINFMILYLLKN